VQRVGLVLELTCRPAVENRGMTWGTKLPPCIAPAPSTLLRPTLDAPMPRCSNCPNHA
jgi:hypothetical protein